MITTTKLLPSRPHVFILLAVKLLRAQYCWAASPNLVRKTCRHSIPVAFSASLHLPQLPYLQKRAGLNAKHLQPTRQVTSTSSTSRPPCISTSNTQIYSTKTTQHTPLVTSDSSDGNSNEFLWRSREDCWRPDIRDVEKISWGMPAKKKGTGSRGVPHRLNQDERRSFDQARRQGFLQVAGSSYRSQRRDSPLLNSYRSLSDARGRPMVILHKGNTGMDDKIVVDLSPLRLPDEFARIEEHLKNLANSGFELSLWQDDNEINTNIARLDEDSSADDNDDTIDNEMWEKRPIYQLPPHCITWELTRQEGKRFGKALAELFNTTEKGASSSNKPKGVKPGKNRRSGGYGIG